MYMILFTIPEPHNAQALQTTALHKAKDKL